MCSIVPVTHDYTIGMCVYIYIYLLLFTYLFIIIYLFIYLSIYLHKQVAYSGL